MTYTVSSGTLNPTQLNSTTARDYSICVHICMLPSIAYGNLKPMIFLIVCSYLLLLHTINYYSAS